MLSKERLQQRFLEMIQVYSPSRREGEMCRWLVDYLSQRGLEVSMDRAGEAYGGDAGNVVAHLKGTLAGAEPICFCAHTDQIEPCRDIHPVLEGKYIKTDGTTTLGGDDKGGIAAILEALEDVLESGAPHPDIYLLFTVTEEQLMLGCRNMDDTLLPCRRVLVADAAGDCGAIEYQAPGGLAIEATFHGKAAHAGLAPENGVSAVVMLSRAIARMKTGRIDHETTSNIGSITGGGANNIVPDTASFTAEARSHSAEKLEQQRLHFQQCCLEAAEEMGGTCDFRCQQTYPPFRADPEGELSRQVCAAMRAEGVEPRLEITGGGSDANFLAARGYECLILSVGMEQVHATNERLNMDELWKTTRVLRRMMG